MKIICGVRNLHVKMILLYESPLNTRILAFSYVSQYLILVWAQAITPPLVKGNPVVYNTGLLSCLNKFVSIKCQHTVHGQS